MSKHYAVSFDVTKRLVDHLDKTVDLSHVDHKGYTPGDFKLTGGRWYYITGKLVQGDNHLTVGMPVQFHRDFQHSEYGRVLEFTTTREALEAFGLPNFNPSEVPLLISPTGSPAHLYKFKEKRDVSALAHELVAAEAALEAALIIENDSKRAMEAANEGVARAVTRVNTILRKLKGA